MFLADRLLTRSRRLPLSSFLCFIGGFSMGSWLTLFHQLQHDQPHQLYLPSGNLHPDYNPHALPPPPSLLLMIMIISSPSNFDRRQTLRSTWINLGGGEDVAHVFVIGTLGLPLQTLEKIEREQEIQGDLLLLPELQDSFDNLTLKVGEGFSHLHLSTPSEYLLKCDDDSFVRTDLIRAELLEKKKSKGPSSSKCLYWGYFDGRAKVQKRGKWREETYNLCDLYIPYALGGGYLLSHRCLQYITRNWRMGELTMFRNEDVSVGTWLGGVVHEKIHDVRFDTEFESRGCNNQHLIQHKISQPEMMERYKHLKLTGGSSLCPRGEETHRPRYHYNFDLPPSQCCPRNKGEPA